MKRIKFTLLLAIATLLPLFGAMSAQAQIDQEDSALPPILPDLDPARAAKPAADINKTLVGWHEARAGAGGVGVGNTLRANWVMLNPTGGIEGRVVGITEPIDIYLIRDGFVVTSSTTLADGTYRMENATEGAYTIVGFSAEAIFATGFLAVASDGAATDLPRSLVSLPVIGKENVKLIAKLINEFAPEVKFREYGVYDIGEGKDDPPEFYGWNGLRDLTEPAIPSNTIQNQTVALKSGGRFVGRIHQIHNQTGRPVEVVNTRVMIIEAGEVVAEAQVDNTGVFEFLDMVPGEFGVIAVGADGIATLGVELVQGSGRGRFDSASATFDYTRGMNASARTVQESEGTFDATLIGPESTGWLNNYVTEQTFIIALNEPLPGMEGMGQMPYNYFDQGGMYGGGGGGGGGGGFGGDWLLPIGIGALIYAATDNNNLGNPIILTSPF